MFGQTKTNYMKKYITIAGGVLSAISPFLPFISLMGISATLHDARGGVAYFFVVVGLIIALMGFLGKRWLNIVSLLLGLVVAGLGFVYMNDAHDKGATVEIGIWMMMAGGIIAIVGSVLGLMNKNS